MLKYVFVCAMVFVAGFVDAVAGGGGLISLPAYMLAGVPTHNAIATNKMSSCMGTTIATTKYALNGFIPWKQVIPAVISAFVGSTMGANLALIVSDGAFRYIMMVLLPIIAFYVLKTKKFNEDLERLTPVKETIVVIIVALIIGVYDGFYGPGTGTFLILLLTGIAHLKLTEANGLTKVINLTTNIAALTVYLINGKVFLLLGITAGCFNIMGNYLGATLFQKDGAKFTRPIMLFVLVIFFIKLIIN